MPFTTNQAFNAAALADLVTNVIIGGVSGCKVKLAQVPFTPNKDSVVADFTEATFTGYAAVTLAAWLTPENLGNAFRVVNTAVSHFEVGSSPTTTNTIGGYWIDDGTGSPAVFGYEVFSPSIPMDTAGLAIDIAVQWQMQMLLWTNVRP